MDELCRMCGKPRNEHYGAIESCFGPMDERNGHYAPRCASCAALRAENARLREALEEVAPIGNIAEGLAPYYIHSDTIKRIRKALAGKE